MASRFAAQLARLDARIEREVLRLRTRYQLTLDEFRGLYVSDEQIDQLLAAREQAAPGDAIEGRPAAGARDDPAWRDLVNTFDLSPLDEDLLLLAAAPEFDLKYETLYAYLNDDVTRKWPTADLARRLLTNEADTATVIAALAPGAALTARHLVQHLAPPTGRAAILNTGYALDPCGTYWLHGCCPALALDHHSVVWTERRDLPAVIAAAAQRRADALSRLAEAAFERADPLPVVALLGDAGSGRTATATAAAASLGRPLARINLHVLGPATDVDERFERLGVALALEPAVVLIEGLDAPGDEEARSVSNHSTVGRAIGRWPPPTLVLLRTNEDERWRAWTSGRRVIEMRCHVETFDGRVALWKDAAHATASDVVDEDLESLAGRFALTPGQVRATLATARDLAAMTGDGRVGAEQIGAAARLTSDRTLGHLATKVERMHDWSDLVLPPATIRRLRELAAAIRHRDVVYGHWGFADRVISGIGIRALFAGASGTGKTMAAGVIARELALDLYKIDLARVVSKYIGETEKNLDRIFRAARTANAIVFLDEAEAIMGKRSEVKDAHDRYANIEVAYLLQKLEEHDGIVILATNLRRNIDDAFNRRMQYVVDFPRPDEADRERIWRGMFPTRAPLGGDVDFGFLARQFDLAGGDIRNVALDAAFLAARDGGVIDMRVIVDALARQLAKQGKTPTGTEFRQYQRLLPRVGG